MKKILFTYLLLWCFAGLTAQYHNDNRIINSGTGLQTNESACTSITLGAGFSFSSDQGKSLYLKIEDSACFPFIITSVDIASNQNYIVTMTPMGETSSVSFMDGDLIMDRSADKNVHTNVTIQYFDGLGRLVENVQHRVTPLGNDLVNLQTYDGLGREAETWLPYPVLNNNGAFVLDPKSDIQTYFNDQKPYSQKVYEASPLNRVLEQYGPGGNWHEKGKSVKADYLTNNNSYPCMLFNINGDGQHTSLSESGNYKDGELFVTETKDEDGNTSYEFKDQLGQVVLTRQLNEGESYDTYYIYDDYGNLAYVLPPMAANSNELGDDTDTMKQYAYLYKYDEHNRCIKKRLPGCEWIYCVYDQSDRLVLSQDGEQRKAQTWSFNKYDELGRLILSGITKQTDTYETLLNEFRQSLSKEKKGHGGPFGYTQNSQPYINESEVLVANFYDDVYSIPSRGDYYNEYLRYEKKAGYGEMYINPTLGNNSAKGLLTGSVVAILDKDMSTPKYLYTAIYYDERGRAIQTRSTNHVAGLEVQYTAYNFTGQPIQTLHEHTANSTLAGLPGRPPLTKDFKTTELYTYTYDHAGRLLETKHKLNDLAEMTLSKNSYDELGRLSSTRYSNNDKQETSYAYNVRSWITEIQSPNFSETLYYNQGTDNPLYNGNISRMIAGMSKYNFTYDNLSRLTQASYIKGGLGTKRYIDFSSSYFYDKHGNIEAFTRKGRTGDTQNSYGDIDDVYIEYQGNQMKTANDIGTDPLTSTSYDFKEFLANNTNPQFAYNTNGAMSEDPYKGMKISYNSLNLPQYIEVNNTQAKGTIKYRYSATGERLAATYVTESTIPINPITGLPNSTSFPVAGVNTTYYVGNKVYQGDLLMSLDKILIPNGYIGDGKYYFYEKDHLGNNRAVVDDEGLVVQQTAYYPFGLPYATGGTGENVQPYKFGGKKLDTMHGLNQYDFEARQLDVAIPRFTSVDPLAEKYYAWSPYVYCGNNPIRITDPTGMDWFIFNEEDGEYESVIEKEGEHRMAMRSEKTAKDGSKSTKFTFFNFNDANVDAESIRNGVINKVELLADNTVESMMNSSGVKTDEARSSKWSYARNNATSSMDYGHYDLIKQNTFYIRDNVAYNSGDIGNYLWGRGMFELGFGLTTARIGAHVNNIVNGDKQISEKYNFGEGTYGDSGFWDAEGDQRAIVNGYYSSPAGQKERNRNRKDRQNIIKKYNETHKTSFSIY